MCSSILLAVHRGQVRRVDDDGPVHARGQVDAHGRGGAVVESDPGALGRELVDERLAGVDGAHDVVGREDPGVKGFASNINYINRHNYKLQVIFMKSITYITLFSTNKKLK